MPNGDTPVITLHILHDVGNRVDATLAIIDGILDRNDPSTAWLQLMLQLRHRLGTIKLICDLQVLPHGHLVDVLPDIVRDLQETHTAIGEAITAMQSELALHDEPELLH